MNRSLLRHGLRASIAFAAIVTALGDFSGCKPRDATAASTRPDVFIFARGSDAQKLDPADVDDGESINTLAQICEGLVRFREGTLEIEPCLANHYDVSMDGLVYAFTLREGVAFHDGTPLTAETAAWSFRRQMDASHPAHTEGAAFQYWTNLFQDVVDVRVSGPMTLEFRLGRPNATLLTSLAICPGWLLSPRSLQDHGEDFQRHPVGTGPYRFAGWTPNQAIILEANPDYWDRAVVPQFKRIVMKVVPENTVRLLELKAGRIHGLEGVQPAELAELAADPRFVVYRDAALNVGYLTFNLALPRYRDPEVRRAFALAIDREKLAQIALGGTGRRADYPVPPGFLGFPEKPEPLPCDPERARAIFARHAADFAEPVRLQIMTAPRPFLPDPVKAASFLRAQLEAVGLRVEIEARDFKSHLDSLRRHDFDCAVIGWIGDSGDSDNFLGTFFGSWATEPGVASNFAGYRDAGMDAVLLEARRVADVAERRRLYARALEIWRRDLPIIPLTHGDGIAVMRREVTGFRIQKSGNLWLGPIGWAADADASVSGSGN